MKVLIIEHSKLIQELLVQHLVTLGIEADIAESGSEALEKTREMIPGSAYDLVLVSFQLRDMDGIAYASEQRASSSFKLTPIILITTDSDRSSIDHALKSGVTEVFQKNKLPELLSFIERFARTSKEEEMLQGKVLLVEDDPTTAMIVKAYLDKMGLLVQVETGGVKALQQIEQGNVDLVITDFMLDGEMSGLGLLQSIRQLGPDKSRIPVLVTSSLDDSSRRIEFLRSGASDFIPKPVIQEELNVRVKNLIMNKQMFDQLELQRRQMEMMALTDQLTGLYNRHSLMSVAPKYLTEACRHGFAISLVVVDVDYFKNVNDNYGHATGDKVLHEVGEMLRDECRSEDMVARFGGEEFVIILTHCGPESAFNKAESLRLQLKKLMPAGLELTASFGVASLPECGPKITFDALFNLADEAVYLAKENGRNRVEINMIEPLPEELPGANP